MLKLIIAAMNVLWCAVTVIESAKILVAVPTPSISHQFPMRPLTQALVQQGHNVVVITTDPAHTKDDGPANLREIDFHDISYRYFLRESKLGNMTRGKRDLYGFIDNSLEYASKISDLQLNSKEFKNMMQNQSFDLVITEGLYRSYYVLSHVFKAPMILSSSMGAYLNNLDVIGAPSHPLINPNHYRNRFYNLSLWEKLTELYNYYWMNQRLQSQENLENALIKKTFGEDLPPLTELYSNVDLLLLNMHPIFEGNPPTPPSVVYMWGIHNKPEKELPQDLKVYLDESKQGVIFASFGLNTDPKTLSSNVIHTFAKVFCQLPYDVLWKWNDEELPGKCKNVRIAKWLPQADLLRHPKIKLFITQGGLQSTDEAMSAGVPLIGIPMWADQWYNAENYERFKIGKQLDIETLTQEEFQSAVTSVIEDESYRCNIRRLNQLMKDQPTLSVERAVRWVTHMLRHGGARHVRAPAANVTLAQYYEIELVCIVATALLVFISILVLSLYYALSYTTRVFRIMKNYWRKIDKKK